MKIYLVRHGQNIDNKMGILNGHRDFPLTDLGVKQAEDLAIHIKNIGISFDYAYTSPLSRAKQTAEIILKNINKEDMLTEESLLIERDFGIMTGTEQSKIEEVCHPDILKTDTVTYFLNPSGAETFPDLMSRAEVLLNKLKSKHPENSNILLVSHGDIGKMIYAKFYNLDWRDVLKDFHFGNSQMLLLDVGVSAKDHFVFKQHQDNI